MSASFSAEVLHLPLLSWRELQATQRSGRLTGRSTPAGWVVALWLFGEQWWTVAVAVGVTIGFMCLTHTVHPPAGAHPIVIVMGAAAPACLLPTLALGLGLLLAWSWGFHRFIRRERHWPPQP